MLHENDQVRGAFPSQELRRQRACTKFGLLGIRRMFSQAHGIPNVRSLGLGEPDFQSGRLTFRCSQGSTR